MFRRIKDACRRALLALRRPLFAGIELRLAELERVVSRAERTERLRQVGLWRGTVTHGSIHAPRPPATDRRWMPDEVHRERLREELEYWRGTIRGPLHAPKAPELFHHTAARWQRDRLRELGRWLKLAPDAAPDAPPDAAHDARLDSALDAWAKGRRAVEIGSGPHPAVCHAPFALAVAVDPLADGFAAEGLFPPDARRVMFVSASGEAVPLVGGAWDLVICENCLDHAEDPDGVLDEASRLLAPGGLLWLLVDLLPAAPDPMHPHPMDADRVDALVRYAGFSLVRMEIRDHRSHPKAKGEIRVLAVKRPDVEPGMDHTKAVRPDVKVLPGNYQPSFGLPLSPDVPAVEHP